MDAGCAHAYARLLGGKNAYTIGNPAHQVQVGDWRKGQKEKAKEELIKLDDALVQKRDAVLELYQELFPEDCGK